MKSKKKTFCAQERNLPDPQENMWDERNYGVTLNIFFVTVFIYFFLGIWHHSPCRNFMKEGKLTIYLKPGTFQYNVMRQLHCCTKSHLRWYAISPLSKYRMSTSKSGIFSELSTNSKV